VTKESNKRSEDESMRLVLDLIGPFVVYFTGARAKIHAPLCVDHNANILTDSDDIALAGSMLLPRPAGGYKEGFIYHLEGPTGSDDKCKCLRPEQLLLVSPKPDAVDPLQCHLVINIPNPNIMVPLLPDLVWMHRNGAKIWVNTADPKNPDIVQENRARGLRLIYYDCPAQPNIQLIKQRNSTSPFELGIGFTPPHPEALGLDPPHYHITLRFASGGTSPDEHHEDAYNCFQTMRSLIPGAGQWRVDFDDSPADQPGANLLRKGGPMPVDCGAMVLVVPE
jgi:hypothetical protein